MKLLIAFCITAIIAFAVFAQAPSVDNLQSKPTVETDPDAYQVYATVIGRGLTDAPNGIITIQRETESFSRATISNIGISGDRTFQKAWGSTLENFVERMRTPRILIGPIPMNSRYELVPMAQVSAPYYSVSSVGFNRAKTKAIVDLGHHCGGLCGGGQPHFLEKKNGKWTEVKVSADIEVWVS